MSSREWQPPPGWVDPRDDPDLPWINHPTPADMAAEPVPPAQRLADEPATVQVASQPPGAYGRIAPAVAGISLTDYSRNPQARGFGAPCTIQLATVQLTEARFTVHVALAELAGWIMRANERDRYLYRRADTGSMNCRKIAGTNVDSWHSWAVAIDANWQTNPYTSPLRTDRPQWERDRWNRYGWAGGWDYSGPKDAMHSEFMGTAGQVPAALDLARRELGGAQRKEGDWLDMATKDEVTGVVYAAVLDIMRKEGISGAGDAGTMLARGYRDAISSAVAGALTGPALDKLATAIVAKLPAGTLTRDDVEASVRAVLRGV